MPLAPPRKCGHPACSTPTHTRYCPAHQGLTTESERRRGNSDSRGYTRRWRTYSKQRLVLHPWCTDPFGDHGTRPALAQCTDHIRPHKGDAVLFWAPWNHQSLCLACNSKKAAKEEGGFGNLVLEADTPAPPTAEQLEAAPHPEARGPTAANVARGGADPQRGPGG